MEIKKLVKKYWIIETIILVIVVLFGLSRTTLPHLGFINVKGTYSQTVNDKYGLRIDTRTIYRSGAIAIYRHDKFGGSSKQELIEYSYGHLKHKNGGYATRIDKTVEAHYFSYNNERYYTTRNRDQVIASQGTKPEKYVAKYKYTGDKLQIVGKHGSENFKKIDKKVVAYKKAASKFEEGKKFKYLSSVRYNKAVYGVASLKG